MADAGWPRERYGEIFWRAQHEAWRQSDLNQREYCEAHGLSLKAFGNWRAKFKAESQPPPRKLLYRRGGLSHRLSHALSHSVSHMTNGLREPALIIPPARDGHRRSFSEADKRLIVDEAGQPGASLSEVARRYGIAARVLFRWKQELKPPPHRCLSRCTSLIRTRLPMRRQARRSVHHDAASSGAEGPLGTRLHRHAQLCGAHDYAECGVENARRARPGDGSYSA